MARLESRQFAWPPVGRQAEAKRLCQNAAMQSELQTHPRPSSSSPSLPVTLLVMTLDEEATIARCLDSVTFVREKIVVDSGSRDRTVEIARAHGARVVHQDWLGFGAQRVFAGTLAAHDWILFLDADEWLSPQLSQTLQRELPGLLDSPTGAVSFARCTWFLGAPMRWYRPLARQIVTRLYHRQRAHWTPARVHEALRTDAPVVQVSGPLVEQGVSTLLERERKDLQYAELKVRDWLDGRSPKAVWPWPLVFIATFLKDYLLRLAFLDGHRGAIAAYLAAHYATYKRLRYWDARRTNA